MSEDLTPEDYGADHGDSAPGLADDEDGAPSAYGGYRR